MQGSVCVSKCGIIFKCGISIYVNETIKIGYQKLESSHREEGTGMSVAAKRESGGDGVTVNRGRWHGSVILFLHCQQSPKCLWPFNYMVWHPARSKHLRN